MNQQFNEPILWDHQREGVRRASLQNNFAFLFEPGTGKTLACITTLRNRFNELRSILPTLIVAPIIVLKNWKDEWLKFTKIDEKRLIILSKSSKKDIEYFKSSVSEFGKQFIVITNYEKLVASKELVEELWRWKPECLVVDESQRIKSWMSARTKIVTFFADLAKYKYLLSGTPILNTPMDIFSQWRALDGGKAFGKNYYTFRLKYFYDKNANMPKQNYFPNWVIRPSAYDEISKIISKDSLRAKKEECLDLPPLIKQTISVELSPDQRRHYKEMKENMLTFLEDESVVANIALTKILRMLQITSGFIKTDEGNIKPFDPNPKAEALKELLMDLTPNHKVIVWCVFKENYKQIRGVCEKLGVKYVECHGELSNKDKFESVDNFCNVEDCRVFIGHPASLGIGINLCIASYSICYSRTWSLEQDIQSEARNYRAGSERHQKITKIDLVCEETIDEEIIKILEKKQTDSEKILESLKKHLTGVKNG